MTVNRFKEEVCTKCNHPCNCDDIVNLKSCQDFINTKIKVFTDNKTKVVAVGSYKGKSVKGVAKCSPEDTFDFKLGKELAVAKCNSLIAWYRYQDAREHIENANKALKYAQHMSDKATCYFEDAEEIYSRALCTWNGTLKKVK